jgi:hypothetical protein
MSEIQRQAALRRWKGHRVADDPDRVTKRRQYNRAAHKRHAEKHFGSEAAKRYYYAFGERIAVKQARIDSQGGKCANRSCGVSIDITTGHQDHDHGTDKKRGVLCQKCNQALGMLQDDASVIDGLAEYRRLF